MFNKSFLDTIGESITMEGAIISDKIAISYEFTNFPSVLAASAILISYNFF